MNRYLIDTNIISEPLSKYPDERVINWLSSITIENQYLSVITIVEIHKGVLNAKDKFKRDRLKQWAEMLPNIFDGRILSVDTPVALCLAKILHDAPKTLPPYDAIIAATALKHGLVMVTRNEKDFRIPDLKLLNLWNS
jgi:predicted nucleic acid-binding protein